MNIIASLPKSNNLPSYIQYDEDTLIKYVDSDKERFAVVRTSDELVHLVYMVDGETKFHQRVIDDDGTWVAALEVIDRLWANFDDLEDKGRHFQILAAGV